MPKQSHKMDMFHGGINDNADPRDILNNELSAAEMLQQYCLRHLECCVL